MIFCKNKNKNNQTIINTNNLLFSSLYILSFHYCNLIYIIIIFSLFPIYFLKFNIMLNKIQSFPNYFYS